MTMMMMTDGQRDYGHQCIMPHSVGTGHNKISYRMQIARASEFMSPKILATAAYMIGRVTIFLLFNGLIVGSCVSCMFANAQLCAPSFSRLT